MFSLKVGVLLNFVEFCGGETAALWQELQLLCADVNLNDDEDRCRWILTKSGKFSERSMYLALKMTTVKWQHRDVWVVKIPLKIKIFLWLAFHNSVLTKDVLIKRGWKGKDSKCCICNELESLDHMFFHCSLAKFIWGVIRCATGLVDVPTHFQDVSAWVMKFSTKERNIVAVGVAAVFWAIWRARNAAVFYHVYPHDPIVVMYSISNWIEKWSIMQKGNASQELRIVARRLAKVASEVFGKRHGWRPVTRRIGVG